MSKSHCTTPIKMKRIKYPYCVNHIVDDCSTKPGYIYAIIKQEIIKRKQCSGRTANSMTKKNKLKLKRHF